MNKKPTRRTTANLPEELLDEAISITGKGITDTLIEGLKLIKRGSAYKYAKKLQGKLSIEIDLDQSRERDYS